VRGDVAIALVTDARVHELNLRYRRKDAPTDVLSFEGSPDTGALGDIVIATGVAKRQARGAGHSYQAELRVLALHGLLHLLGYEHHRSEEAGRMGRLEARLRRKGGLAAGLIERSESGMPPARRAAGKDGTVAPPMARNHRRRAS